MDVVLVHLEANTCYIRDALENCKHIENSHITSIKTNGVYSWRILVKCRRTTKTFNLVPCVCTYDRTLFNGSLDLPRYRIMYYNQKDAEKKRKSMKPHSDKRLTKKIRKWRFSFCLVVLQYKITKTSMGLNPDWRTWRESTQVIECLFWIFLPSPSPIFTYRLFSRSVQKIPMNILHNKKFTL